jgi:dihydrolipoamide dehydrogenase
MSTPTHDLAIVGSGPGGYRAAVLGALRGLRVAVIEASTWGGCCLNRGCVPKKDWHHSAHLIAAGARFAGRGIVGDLHGNLGTAWTHQRGVVDTVRSSYLRYLTRLGVTRVQGRARLADATTLEIEGGEPVRAKHIVLATGSSPWFPPDLRPVAGRILSTDELFEQPPPPGRRVAIAGSGVVATEFAFILAMFGLDVVWLARNTPLASSRYSAAARDALASALSAHGVRAPNGRRVLRAQAGAAGVRLEVADGTQLDVDWLLVAAGRRPNSGGLGLEQAGVRVDADGFVCVDAQQRTSLSTVFAIGDLCSREMTANQALAQAAVAIDNVLAPGSSKHEPESVPNLVYSALKLGRIGLNEEEAEARGFEPALGLASFEVNPRALGQDDAAGFVRIVADHDRGTLLGAEIVGSEAGELINLIGQQIGRPGALRWLAATRFNHPTRSEEIGNAVETLAARWGLEEHVFGSA